MISHCICCSLLTGCILGGLMSLFLYVLAFAMETWWIIEAKVNLPVPAYLLALVYFFLSLLSVVMMVGLRGKKTRMLLAWMIFFLLAIFPEAGMVLFMGVYYWSGGVNGLIELSLWLLRAFITICTTLCVHSLYSYWRDEKSVVRSLQELGNNQNNVHALHSNGLFADFEKAPSPPRNLSFYNAGYHGSQHQLNQLNVTKYSSSNEKGFGGFSGYGGNLRRSTSAISSSSNFVSASRLSLNDGLGYDPQFNYNPLQPPPHPQLSPPINYDHQLLSAAAERRRRRLASRSVSALNEFDSSKYLHQLPMPPPPPRFSPPRFSPPRFSQHSTSQGDAPPLWDPRLPSFGLDPDTLVFAPPHHDGMGSLMSKDMLGEDMDSNIQWYRPRSLVNAEEDIGSSSLLSGSEDDYGTHSLDRRRHQQQKQQKRRPSRSRSTGALNNLLHDMEESDDDVRFRGMDPIRNVGMDHGMHGQQRGGLFGGFSGRGVSLLRARTTAPAILHYGDSKISLGQVSDHIDKYRDIAL